MKQSKKISEKNLKQFSKEEHKKFLKQSVAEGIVALLPIAALGIGFSVIYARPDSQELMAPERLGVISFLLPLVVIAYFVFLFFVIRDIKKRMKQK